jgi:hypothetical protein
LVTIGPNLSTNCGISVRGDLLTCFRYLNFLALHTVFIIIVDPRTIVLFLSWLISLMNMTSKAKFVVVILIRKDVLSEGVVTVVHNAGASRAGLKLGLSNCTLIGINILLGLK